MDSYEHSFLLPFLLMLVGCLLNKDIAYRLKKVGQSVIIKVLGMIVFVSYPFCQSVLQESDL